ncbi:MAG: hypothetical protein NXI31_16765 [bacterium]|nr:hypothetical protein [bacterium]
MTADSDPQAPAVPDPDTAALLAAGPFVRQPAAFRVLAVRGPDAADFLQRLCSQDVVALAAGVAVPAAFLDGKGKLLVTCLVQRDPAEAETIWLETHAEQHDRLVELLDRYHFSERLTFEAPADWSCQETVASANASGNAAPPGLEFAITRRGIRFVRRHGPAADLPTAQGEALADELGECLRMAAGFVRVGLESEPKTLALEADLADHCSTTKGCYTGQEIVARIHTYGHTNRKLCFLKLAPGAVIQEPQALHEVEDDLPVGRVMHAVPTPTGAARFGLGYLPPDFQAPGTQLRLAAADGGEAAVAADVTVVW